MKCSRCKENEAKIYFSKNINGKNVEYNYCESCAKELSQENIGNFAKLFSEFFNNFSNNTFQMNFTDDVLYEEDDDDYCPVCKTTYSQIVKNAKVGCAGCYSHFYDRLAPSIKRIHGETNHIGKISSTASMDVKKNSEILKLKRKLNTTVLEEKYEEAAIIRDQIILLQEGI